ncbi:alpha/beta-hydrolase [Aulographum hederae CBS 113979]|uniref:Alpha/beta-hydrolase n=1 Tax=Aulographum hederae CBS 113979 TaxID=1176131 RepID=A0A6G1GU21_9PEZI|nr:alpha/beta-hydrolase [Aulographum hederae CBS 113979]
MKLSPLLATTRVDFNFTSQNQQIAGDLYLPQSPPTNPSSSSSILYPAVLTAPGFAGVKEMMIPEFCTDLAAHGIACLGFDYPGFGASSGVLRQEVNPGQQLQTFRDAVDVLATDPRVDKEKLGIWGTSFAGGHTIVIASEDERIKAAVPIIPFISAGNEGGLDIPMMTSVVLENIANQSKGWPPGQLDAAGSPGSRAVMNTDGALAWANGQARNATRYLNYVAASSLLKIATFSTAEQAKKLNVPTLCVTALDDSITPANSSHAALDGVPGIRFVDFPGAHFELFDDNKDAVIKLVTDFFVEQFLPGGNGTVVAKGRMRRS